MPDALNYARFDNLGDDSDDDEPQNQRVDDARKAQLLAQHDAMFLLVGWISKACPKVSDVETTRLVRFVATSDKAIEPDKAKRFAAVATFMKDEARVHNVDRKGLIQLCNFAQARVSDAGDANERLAASRVLILAMGALNTLGAVESTYGGADAVASELKASPSGDLARKIEDFEFAKAIIREAPPAREEIEMKAPAEGKGKGEGKGEGEGEGEEEMTAEEEAELMREAMANARKIRQEAAQPRPWSKLTVAEKLARLRRGTDSRAWVRILHSTGFNIGLIFVAWLCRQAYEQYYGLAHTQFVMW